MSARSRRFSFASHFAFQVGRGQHSGVFLLLILLAGSSIANAQEPWAQPELPVKDSLYLWLDAEVQPGAWKHFEKRGLPLADGRPFDVWFDGTGNKRHIVQRLPASQPTFRQIDDWAFVRFDGEDDYLSRIGNGEHVDEFTLLAFVAPNSNAGGFRALLGTSAFGQNDYTSGFNIDQSGGPSARFQTVNVEGNGFSGARDLMSKEFPFGSFHLIEVVANAESVRVIVDGDAPGVSRPRTKRELSLDEIIVGARLFSNEARPSFVQGFFDGGLAELLFYDRALDAEELAALRQYLLAKHDGLNDALAALDDSGGFLLESVENPPPVQMFVPGFSARELPVELPNINNVLYRSDGRLVALAYNGDVYLLRDTNNDGLEDRADLFWDNRGRLQAPIGLALTPEDYPHGDGVFVASKGKCSLIVDTDGDDIADEEKILAEGWPALPHGVDALGVAFDSRDGSVYFGLGTQNFANGYLLDENGQGHYSVDGDRGTILRISPDFKRRDIYCSGIRFPVALRFNSEGDLFCTDQEGATWLPNGNPFDELLHVQPGRHYGFPPRHPKHLPHVIDEPSTYDYGPQHQSTCGLNFNEPVHGGPVFGPAGWRGDALVTGYSRGKLYRTQLVKTEAGYVAQNHLLACLNMLPADACISPRGDLLVAVHSGGPDWGSGPAGRGKLYRIRYDDAKTAQPVIAWPAGPREVRIAFDRPIDPEDLKGLGQSIAIEHSPWTRAGDRFESLRPGYAVVQMQMATRRFPLPVHGVSVTPDRRTLVVNTAAHRHRDHYAISFPWASRRQASADDLPQHATVDLDYTLQGVEASLRSTDGRSLWDGWLPHIDLKVARSFTSGSLPHETLWKQLDHPRSAGAETLTLRTQFDLSDMLRAAVQPGSQLNFDYPPEAVTIVLESEQEIEVRTPAGKVNRSNDPSGRTVVHVRVEKPGRRLVPVEITLPLIRESLRVSLDLAWHTQEDERPRPLALRRLFVPWVNPEREREAETLERPDIPEQLAGGSWGRGRRVFFSEKALCAKCHRVGGEGGTIGPDLSNLIHRDYRSVVRDITQPSFAINPDHLSYSIALEDGRVLSGVVRRIDGKLIVGDQDGKQIEVDPSDVEEMVPSKISVMPEGIDKKLSPDAMRDLLTYLLTPPPSMPRDLEGGPEPRSVAEVREILEGSDRLDESLRPLHIVLVAGRKDHGPGEHDYPAWLKVWGRLLEAAENVTVTRVMEWPDADQFSSADAIVFYQKGTWSDERAREIDAFLERGGGVTYLHYAVDGGPNSGAFAQRIGLAWQGGRSRFRHGGLDLIFDSEHPIARNFRRVHFHDESYWNLTGDPKEITVLASGLEENALQPLLWTREQKAGRVFVSILGHYSWTFDDPLFRILLLRGIAWSAGESVDRFNDLVLPGAHVQETGRSRR